MSIIFDPVKVKLNELEARVARDDAYLKQQMQIEEPQPMKDRKQLLKVAKMVWKQHQPLKTGRTEYSFHPSTFKKPYMERPITGTAPTYRCASHCGGYFFADQGCPSYEELATYLGVTPEFIYGLEPAHTEKPQLKYQQEG